MPTIPLVGGTSGSSRVKPFSQRSVNVYPEAADAEIALIQFPGGVAFANAAGEVRGFHEAFGRWFAVVGATVYEVTIDGTMTSLGTLTTDSGPVSMDHNPNEVCLVDGEEGYVIQKAGTTLTLISDTDFPANPTFVAFLDGYGIILEGGTQKFWRTALNDFESLTGTDFASAEGSPDDLLGLITDHRELWLAGKKTIEVWSTVSSVSNPIQRNPSGFIERGTIAGHSLTQMGGTLYWLGNDREPYQAQGLAPVPITSPLISKLIQDVSNPELAIGQAIEFEGHKFWQLTFPGELTIRYDVSTGEWHEGRTYLRDDFIGHHAITFSDRHFVGGPDGKITELKPGTHAWEGEVYKRSRKIGPIRSTSGELLTMSNLELTMQTGVTNLTDEPEVILEISDDGFSYPDRLTAGLGELGEYRSRVHFPALGSFYERSIEVAVTDDCEFALVSGFAEIE